MRCLEILPAQAYSENRLPHMHLLEGKDEILVMSNEVNFFNYYSFCFSVKTLSVLGTENVIKRAVPSLKREFVISRKVGMSLILREKDLSTIRGGHF